MAIFGVSLYGQDKYGPGVRNGSGTGPFAMDARSVVDYNVEPFIADASDYESINLTWRSPTGDWTEFRVVKNWLGFPVTSADGDVVLSSTSAVTAYTDHNVKPGEWHYYSLWVKTGAGAWNRAASACTLMLRDYGYGRTLFDSLPGHHRLLQGHMDDLPTVENEDLKGFLKVLGMGLNYVKTYYDSMKFLHDPMRARTDQLLALADELGVEYSPASPAQLYRQRVLNAAVLGREKGTPEAIRSLVSLVTGWDVDLIPGSNLMLSEDQASFAHPTYDLWDAGINYPAGYRVTYNGYLYTAKTGGAYGSAQAPSGNNTSNTWWTLTSNVVDTTLKAADGSFAGWVPVNYSGGAVPTDAVAVGVGVQSATDPTVSWANALVVQNSGATTADLGARAAGGTLTDPNDAVLRGVPIPRAVPWDSATSYEIGAVVSYSGNTFFAERESLGVTPSTTDHTYWSLLTPVDDRVSLVVSAHVKGLDATSQTRLAYPVIDLFDIHGAKLGTIDTSNLGTQTYDSLFRRPGTLVGRTTDNGGKTWTVSSGTWKVVDGVGLACYGTGLALLPGDANGQVSTTRTGGAPGSSQALVFRASDASNYFKATRTGLYRVSAGAATLVGTFSTPFADRDRVTAVFNGSAITILRNGTGVLSVTDAFNSTATQHGTLVE